MKIEIEESASDIDWFFTDQKNIGFVASGGGKLPLSISNASENIQMLASYFRTLPDISEVEINPLLEEIMGDGEVDADYLSDFIYMATKGLYSFDKTFVGEYSDDRYHLVAKPVTALKLSDLPLHIAEAVSQTISANGFQEKFMISSFS